MTRQTKPSVSKSSKGFIRVASKPPRSRFPDPEDNPEFWVEYARFPRHELAEAVIAMRKLRGVSQVELARRIGTKQPAIARIEAAKSNVGLDTIQAIAIALDAGISISLRPSEGEAESRPSLLTQNRLTVSRGRTAN